MQAWPTWFIKTAVDSGTLFQDRRRAIQSFFWIKDFSLICLAVIFVILLSSCSHFLQVKYVWYEMKNGYPSVLTLVQPIYVKALLLDHHWAIQRLKKPFVYQAKNQAKNISLDSKHTYVKVITKEMRAR